MMNSHLILCSIAAAVTVTSCTSGHAALTRNGARPTVLRYCFTLQNEDPSAGEQRLAVVKRYLSSTLHVDVEAVTTTQYGAVVEAFRANKVDVASISPFAYIIAAEKAPVEAILMREKSDG